VAARLPGSGSVAQRERDHFDRLIRDRGDFNPFADRGWRTLARRFEAFVAPERPLDVLDVGCGAGRSRQLYAAHTAHYVGVDLSAEAVALARARFPASEWQVADACDLPFPSRSFDIVAFSSVLHHIPNFTDALREAARVLRPGGRAFAFDPNLLHPAMALFRHPSSPLYSPEGVSPDERPLLPKELRRAFAAAGFVDLLQRGQSDIPYRSVAPRLLNACLSAYNLADRVWERVGLGRWFGTFVVTCGRKPA
jgi:SAM-dependent methyltransferase